MRLPQSAAGQRQCPDVEQIAAGAQFAMVLGTDGSVWERGDNTYGELHDQGSDAARVTPFESIGPGSGITQIAAGGNTSLAIHAVPRIIRF